MVPTNTDEQCVLYLKWNIDVLLSGQFPSHDHLGNPLTGRRAERRGELAGGWRAAFVGHTADCKEKVRMHRLARNWACNFLCEKCLGCRRCVSLALSLSLLLPCRRYDVNLMLFPLPPLDCACRSLSLAALRSQAPTGRKCVRLPPGSWMAANARFPRIIHGMLCEDGFRYLLPVAVCARLDVIFCLRPKPPPRASLWAPSEVWCGLSGKLGRPGGITNVP